MPRDTFDPEDPQTTWLSTGEAPNRKMSLLDEFTYFDRKGKPWRADKGREVDGASIPRPLWAIVGSPYTGAYRRASIVHDIACEDAKGDYKKRRKGDRMYYQACRKGGCSVPEAIVQYIGVTLGSWASRLEPLNIYSDHLVLTEETAEERKEREIADAIIVGTFNELYLGVRKHFVGSDRLTAEAEDAVFAKVQREVDKQLKKKSEQLKNVL